MKKASLYFFPLIPEQEVHYEWICLLPNDSESEKRICLSSSDTELDKKSIHASGFGYNSSRNFSVIHRNKRGIPGKLMEFCLEYREPFFKQDHSLVTWEKLNHKLHWVEFSKTFQYSKILNFVICNMVFGYFRFIL